MIDVQNISLGFGERVLFQDLSFQLGDRDKICLSGRNGSGKTTLLNMLAGESKPESGTIIRSRNVKIGYLRQHLDVPGDASVFDAAHGAFSEGVTASLELDDLQAKMESHGASDEDLTRLGFLHDEMERTGYYSAESETRKVLSGLGFSPEQQDKPLKEFSGGWRMRVALARILLEKPTCLLLDEPTNHLDLESILWLEGYIRGYTGSLALISHDRLFVDRVCARVLELERGALFSFPLPYSRYLDEREIRRQQLLREYKKQQDEIQSLERFVERFKAKASKATQAQSKQKQLDRIDRIVIPDSLAQMRVRFPESPPSGRWVFEAEGLAKRYGDNVVFTDGKFSVEAGQKVVLVGPNGAGKTTLLRILLGEEKPDEGFVTMGHNVIPGYFAQYEEPDEREKSMDLVKLLSSVDPKVTSNQIRSILGSMLFSGDDAFKPFGILSGGEQARVRMCRLLLRNCNLLVLDEPTNHLDMASKELLMQAMIDFKGTVLFVSHDRFFVERIATRVLLVKDRGIVEYPGDYAYYCHKAVSDMGEDKSAKAVGSEGAKNTMGTKSGNKGDKNGGHGSNNPPALKADLAGDYELRKEKEKQVRKNRKRLEEIEADILRLEGRISEIEGELCEPDIFSDTALCLSKTREREEASARVTELYLELERLEDSGHSHGS